MNVTLLIKYERKINIKEQNSSSKKRNLLTALNSIGSWFLQLAGI